MLDDPIAFDALAFAVFVAEGTADDQYHDHAGDEYADYARILGDLDGLLSDYASGDTHKPMTIRNFLSYLEEAL